MSGIKPTLELPADLYLAANARAKLLTATTWHFADFFPLGLNMGGNEMKRQDD